MDARVRHLGLVVKNLEAEMQWFKWFGFDKVSKAPEIWGDNSLLIGKMTDKEGSMIELIQGDWKPHVALTVKDGSVMEDIWLKFGTKNGTIMERKNRTDKTILYLRNPSGNYTEVVYER